MHATTDFDDVLADDEIDAVLLCTPISTHFEMGRGAGAGKHVFIEKPMAETVAECDALAALAAERQLIVMPGHTLVYSPQVVRTKSMLEEGRLGRLHFGTSTRVNWGSTRATRASSGTWPRTTSRSSILLQRARSRA